MLQSGARGKKNLFMLLILNVIFLINMSHYDLNNSELCFIHPFFWAPRKGFTHPSGTKTTTSGIAVMKGKGIHVTGRVGPQNCETLRLPHLLDYRLTDGGKFVSLTRRPPFTTQEDSWYSFLSEAESTPRPQ
jgi:hypothetical protein